MIPRLYFLKVGHGGEGCCGEAIWVQNTAGCLCPPPLPNLLQFIPTSNWTAVLILFVCGVFFYLLSLNFSKIFYFVFMETAVAFHVCTVSVSKDVGKSCDSMKKCIWWEQIWEKTQLTHLVSALVPKLAWEVPKLWACSNDGMWQSLTSKLLLCGWWLWFYFNCAKDFSKFEQINCKIYVWGNWRDRNIHCSLDNMGILGT